MADKKRRKNGFTLIELMIVVIILGLLASIVVPKLFKSVGKAKPVAAKTQIENLKTALSTYWLENNAYPTTEQGLTALVKKPEAEPLPANWDGPYMDGDVPKDPWGNDYVYESPSGDREFAIISYGADGKEGGEKENSDISSFK